MRRFSVLLAVFVAYVATARLGLSIASLNPSATPVWPPSGIAIAALLFLGRSAWPLVFLSAFIVNVNTAGSLPISTLIAFGNTIEAVAGAYLLVRVAEGKHALGRASTIFRFAAVMLPPTAISATIGVTTLCLGGLAAWHEYGAIWVTWWLGDLSGALVVVPLVLAWSEPVPDSTEPARWFEIAALYCAVSGSAVIIFSGFGPWPAHTPLAYLTIPALVWAAFRFGQRETTTSIALLSLIATWSTIRELGPFADAPSNTSLLILQTFIATLTTTMLPIAAVVAERKRAEWQRAQMLAHEHAARITAEATSSAKDEFLAMLGHELRNPLAAITTATHVLNVLEPRQGAAGQAQNVIVRQVKHLASLVDDLLDVTRVRTGKITLERGSVDLAALVSRSVEALRLSEGSQDVKSAASIQVDFSLTAPIWVDGDPTRLEQIVTNLLTNALKYTPPTGTIHVTTARERDQIVLRVADDGIGIDARLLPRIFDQFIQADRGPARTEGGLGLGLTLVKHLVELHGGTVTAASDGPGRGSVFTVHLPAASPPAAAQPSLSTPSPTRRRVVLVEDQADAREMMRLSLELSGHEVFEAGDGPGAVEVLLRIVPDIAFVDLGLPIFDGYEVARRVRSVHGPTIVLIALTGYGQPEDRARAEAAGFDLHLVKPVDPEVVSELVSVLPRGIHHSI